MATDATPYATRQHLWLLAVLSVLLGFASISTDLYLPALPAMAADLGASDGALQWTISGYLAGFAIGQLFWGPLSDRYGRRVPVTLGVLVFVIGSAGCALSTDAWQIIGWRVVQALGASAGVALARAMVRDLYARDDAARVLSTLMTVMAVAPLLGPVAGAQILEHASWQAIFWVRVAELARAGRRPTCITGPVRCTAAAWHENQHARWPVAAPALPARLPGGVWRPAMKDRKGRERYEGYCTPVTYDPTPQQVAASCRDYLAWWAAIHEVRERLYAAPVLRDHELTAVMPPVSPDSEAQDQ